MDMGASTIYTNYPGGNLVHKQKTKKKLDVVCERPVTKYIQTS